MTAPRVTPFPSDKLEKGSLKDGVHVGFDLELVHRVDPTPDWQGRGRKVHCCTDGAMVELWPST